MTTTTLTPAGYIIADGLAIYGAAADRAAVEADARQWMDLREDSADVLADMCDGVARIHGQIYIAPATAALIDMVQNDGGDIAWNDWDGICCTCDEFEAAQAAA